MEEKRHPEPGRDQDLVAAQVGPQSGLTEEAACGPWGPSTILCSKIPSLEEAAEHLPPTLTVKTGFWDLWGA